LQYRNRKKRLLANILTDLDPLIHPQQPPGFFDIDIDIDIEKHPIRVPLRPGWVSAGALVSADALLAAIGGATIRNPKAVAAT